MSTTSVPNHSTSPAGASTTGTTTDTDADTDADAAEHRLRTVLRVDALASGTTGLLAAIAPAVVDDVLGTGWPGWVRLVGIGFLAFALDVGLLSRAQTTTLRRWAPVAAVANGVYVVGVAATIALGCFDPLGAVLVGLTGALVGTFGALQWRFGRSMR